MNWNFLAGDYLLRLPNAEHDQHALLELLQASSVSAHLPRLPMITTSQIEDEFRRMAQRFQAREAAFWWVEDAEDKALGRVSIQQINWLQRSAQLVWEWHSRVVLADLHASLPKLFEFCFQELGLHRLEMRWCEADSSVNHAEFLHHLGFQHEGILPLQGEFQGQNYDHQVWSLLKSAVPVS